MHLADSVNSVKGVGDKKAKLLKKLGIATVRDLLYYVPRDYESPSMQVNIDALRPDEKYSITATVQETPKSRRIRNGLTLCTFSLEDDTGSVEAVFFNMPYIGRMYKRGDTVYVAGKTKLVGRRLQFTNPHMEREGGQHEGLNPIYALTGGLTQKVTRILMKQALAECAGIVQDIFPNEFAQQYNLAEVNFSLNQIHFPDDENTLKQAKRRLLFEELLLFNIALAERQHADDRQAAAFICGRDTQAAFLKKLEYTPTNAQTKVMSEIEDDICSAKPMSRLLQGDVGSGKTTPALYAMYLSAQNGKQSVMMAPTEVLARQHFETAQNVFGDETINIELITGSTPPAQKKAIYENVAGGLTDIVIGTHAVLYDKIQFAGLGLIVTDEQHRFGVGQRAALESKAAAPHTLIMSATPIPRSLALILYGETDISIIDEMPPGRLPVKTFCVREAKRADMYGFLDKEIASGAQVFAVCPLVEQSEDLDAVSSQEVFESMSERFGEKNVALLHGRMTSAEKQDVMQRFKDKSFSILVSTTVIEVGVDIPSATVMVVENAERFGLAQLHQLRGRVGRSSRESYCFLMSGQRDNERLRILTETNDGFKISEEDLRLRGPGQFLGSRQSGMSDLYMANLIRDMKLLRETKQIAAALARGEAVLYGILSKKANEVFADKFDQTTVS